MVQAAVKRGGARPQGLSCEAVEKNPLQRRRSDQSHGTERIQISAEKKGRARPWCKQLRRGRAPPGGRPWPKLDKKAEELLLVMRSGEARAAAEHCHGNAHQPAIHEDETGQ